MTSPVSLPKGIDLLPSGSFRARIQWMGTVHKETFASLPEAVAWRSRTARQLKLGTHESQQDIDPETGEELAPLFGDYADGWLAARTLKARTRADYRAILDSVLIPHFGDRRVDAITPKIVKAWHAKYAVDRPTARARAYGLLRAVLNGAYSEDLIQANPCRVRGAGTSKRASVTTLPTAAQVAELADLVPTGKYRLMVLVSAWCGLRFGELTELRRKDVVGDVIRVRRGVTRVGGEYVVDSPKSYAGRRDVVIPPHIRDDVAAYLETVPASPEALLFPGSRNGRHMAPSALYKVWYPAREAVGLDTLRWHDLRHFAGTTAAQTGASLKQIQARLGHSTVAAAMRYQHAAQDQDELLAEQLSRIAGS